MRSFGATKVEVCPFCGQHLHPYSSPEQKKGQLKKKLTGFFKRDQSAQDGPDPRSLLEQARGLRTMHRYPEALQAFEELLVLAPQNGQALEGRFSLLVEMLRKPEAHQAGTAYLEHLIRINDQTGATNVYRQLQNLDESGLVDVESLWTVANWFRERGLHMDAVKALKRLAVMYSRHDRAPEALLLGAQLLDEELGKPQVARSFYLQLAKSYPRHELAQQAQKALSLLAEKEPDKG